MSIVLFLSDLQKKERALRDSNSRLESRVAAMTAEVEKLRALYGSLREEGIVA